jgi:hypothetical protein
MPSTVRATHIYSSDKKKIAGKAYDTSDQRGICTRQSFEGFIGHKCQKPEESGKKVNRDMAGAKIKARHTQGK